LLCTESEVASHDCDRRIAHRMQMPVALCRGEVAVLDVIDLVVAPLTGLNPVRYWLDTDYRAKKKHEFGIRTKRILVYQFVVSVFVVAALVGVVLVLTGSV